MNKKLALLVVSAALLSGCSKLLTVPLVGSLNAKTGYTIAPTGNKILILGGQSNMLGRGMTTSFPQSARVALTPGGNTLTGPGYYAASLLSNDFPGWKVTVVECAVGSTYISQWVKGGDHYQPCIDAVKAERAKGGEIVGMLFYQGENDGRDTLTTSWAQDFEGMVRDMRADLGRPGLPVVYAQIAYDTEINQTVQNNWEALQAIQAGVQLSNCSMIKTKDVAHVVDDVHLDEASCIKVGQRFERAFLNLITD